MSAPWTFRLPDVGEGIPEAELLEWHVEVGDTVAEGAPLAEVMTDKATVQLPSPVSGTIEWLGATPGDLVPVGADLVRFTTASNGSDSNGSVPASAAPAPAAAPTRVPPPPRAPPSPAPPPAPAPAARRGADPFAVGEPDDRAAVPEPSQEAAGRVLAAPVVRHRARQLGVALESVDGTGPDGRITHEDLDRELLAGRADRVGPTVPDGSRDDRVERVQLRGLRRSIARHMQLASERIPHFTYVEEVDVTELQRLRPLLDREWSRDATDDAHASGRVRTGVLEFVLRAVVLAVRDHPEMNARFDDEAGVVERHAAVHLGVAVQTPEGLVVTVVRHAETMDLRGCAAEVGRLSASARSGRATLRELSGSTITVSSLGALGGIVSTPIVNHPEVAIVGVNRIAERPVVHDGVVTVRQVMNLSSSFDHRVVDGWDAARFVQRIKELLEAPALLLTR